MRHVHSMCAWTHNRHGVDSPGRPSQLPGRAEASYSTLCDASRGTNRRGSVKKYTACPGRSLHFGATGAAHLG